MCQGGRITEKEYIMKTITTYQGRVPQATHQIDVIAQWRQAVQGKAEARRTLLERIMSRRSSRPNTPRLSAYNAG